MDDFRDKVAIVTGGASGLGQAVCVELGARGAVVVAADINAEGAQEVASGITRAGGRATAKHVDTSQAEAVEKLVGDTVDAHGRLDLMFNNAGIAVGGDYRDMTLELWRQIIEVINLCIIDWTSSCVPSGRRLEEGTNEGGGFLQVTHVCEDGFVQL